MAVITGNAPLKKVTVHGKETIQLPEKSIVVYHTALSPTPMPLATQVVDDSPTQIERWREEADAAYNEALASAAQAGQRKRFMAIGAGVLGAAALVWFLGR